MAFLLKVPETLCIDYFSIKKTNVFSAVFALFILGSVFPLPIPAEGPAAEDNKKESPAPEETEEAEETPAEYGRDFPMAFGQLMAANIGIWAYDYIIMQPYARVSPTTWKNNIEKGPEWDNSDFFTNQILHPYHGSAYYTGARAYGFSYWESLAFAELGSYTWEYYAERDTPSINDLIVTAVGGAAFGEAGYRLAIALSHSNDRGARKFFREFAAWIANPMYKINEAAFGESFVERNRLPRAHLDIILRAGVNYTRDDDTRFNERFSEFPHAYIGGGIAYGNPWDSAALYGPYDFFQVKIDGEPDWRNPSWDIFADAVLCGFKLYPGNEARLILGLYQQFDYLENLVYKMAANGAGAGLRMLLPAGDSGSFEFKSYFYWVILGVLDSRYSRWEIDNYDTKDAGWSSKLSLSYLCDYFSLSLNYFYYRLRVLDGSGWTDIVKVFTAAIEAPVTRNTGLGLELRYYERWASDVYDSAWAWSVKTFVTYKL